MIRPAVRVLLAVLLPSFAGVVGCRSVENRQEDAPARSEAEPAEMTAASPEPATAGLAGAVVPVQGMACGGCATRIETALQRMPGIALIRVDHDAGQAVFTYDPARVQPHRVAERIQSVGFTTGSPKPASIEDLARLSR